MTEEHSNASVLWQKARDLIRKKVPDHVYMQWFAAIVPIRMEDRKIILGVSDDLFANWLTDNYQDYLCEGLESIYFAGTAEEWAGVEIKDKTEQLLAATVYFYSEAEPTEEGSYWHYGEDGEVVAW